LGRPDAPLVVKWLCSAFVLALGVLLRWSSRLLGGAFFMFSQAYPNAWVRVRARVRVRVRVRVGVRFRVRVMVRVRVRVRVFASNPNPEP